jgi:hypothetical protein
VAGITAVRSVRCKVSLRTDLAYRTALCSVTRNRCRRSDGQPLTLDVLNVEIYDILPVVQCPPYTSRVFSVLPFPPIISELCFPPPSIL